MDIDAVSQEIRRALFDVIEDRQRINSTDFDETIRKVLASRTIRSAPAGTAGQQHYTSWNSTHVRVPWPSNGP